jgi:Protein of unknown function (DUF2490)
VVNGRERARAAATRAAALILFELSVAVACAGAQESSEGSYELGLWKRLSARELIYVPLAVTRAGEVEHAEALAGVSYVRILSRVLATRVGYRYSWELTPPADGEQYREHRAVGEVTVRPWPGTRIELLDRSRLELRWIDGVPAWRLRNRILGERRLAPRRAMTFTPYGTVEASYDSRYRTVNRLRASVGVATKLNSHVSLDNYVARARDSRGGAARLEALGMTLNLTY